MPNLNAFRFRLRAKQVPAPTSSEDDSDHDQPPISIRITVPRNAQKSRERLVGGPFTTREKPPPRAPTKTIPEKSNPSLSLNHTAHTVHVHPQTRKSSKSALVSSGLPNNASPSAPSTKDSPATNKQTLIRRVTSKLHISIPTSRSLSPISPPPLHSPSSHGDMNRPPHLSRSPRVTIPTSPTLPNSFVSKECREAALRERGLLPPRPDLSEQERQADERLGVIAPTLYTISDGLSAAEKLKEEWMATNRTSESSASDCGLAVIRPSPQTRSHRSSSLSDSSCQTSAEGDGSRQSHDSRTEFQLAGRPSISSTMPPLSASSYLEVLHEEPSEQGPITPPPPQIHIQLPIIVSTPVEDVFPSSPVIAESPISCSFLTSPGPASVSQSQLSAAQVLSPPEKENDSARLPPPPASRRRTTDSGDRRRKSVGQTLSRFAPPRSRLQIFPLLLLFLRISPCKHQGWHLAQRCTVEAVYCSRQEILKMRRVADCVRWPSWIDLLELDSRIGWLVFFFFLFLEIRSTFSPRITADNKSTNCCSTRQVFESTSCDVEARFLYCLRCIQHDRSLTRFWTFSSTSSICIRSFLQASQPAVLLRSALFTVLDLLHGFTVTTVYELYSTKLHLTGRDSGH